MGRRYRVAATAAYAGAAVFILFQTFLYVAFYYLSFDPLAWRYDRVFPVLDDAALATAWLCLIPAALLLVPARPHVVSLVVSRFGVAALLVMSGSLLVSAGLGLSGFGNTSSSQALILQRLMLSVWLGTASLLLLTEGRFPKALAAIGVVVAAAIAAWPKVESTHVLNLVLLAGVPAWMIWVGVCIGDLDPTLPQARPRPPNWFSSKRLSRGGSA